MWQLLSEPVAQRLSATLLHFLWQGTLLAIFAATLLQLLRAAKPHIRYAVAYGMLVAMAAAPLATFFYVKPSVSRPAIAAAAANPAVATLRRGVVEEWNRMNAAQDAGTSPAAPGFSNVDCATLDNGAAILVPQAASDRLLVARFSAWTEPLQPYLLGAWLLGVALCTSRLLAGIGGIWWLRRDRSAVPVWLNVSLVRLGRRLGMNTSGRVYASPRVDEAVAVGFWRPIVLVPMSWLTELPADMVEAIVAHELAHIRRFDLWAVFGQRLVETVLFYHPAVWWLSRRVSTEREMCCDAVAVAATGARSTYVRALETVGRRSRHDTVGRSQQDRLQPRSPQRKSSQTVSYALATSFRGEEDMVLLKRVRQVLGLRAQSEAGRSWPAGALVAGLALGAWALASGIGVSADEPREGDKPKAEAGREGGAREGGAREGDRPAAEGARREGDRPAAEGSRREAAAREGARDGQRRPEGARDGERKSAEGARDGERRPAEGARGEDANRRNSEAGGLEGFKPQTDREEALVKMIMSLRNELATLRRQVEAGRTGNREGGARPAVRDGERRPEGARDGERPRTGPRDGEGGPRTGPRDGERRPEGARDGERRPEGARDGERKPAEGERREGERRPAEGEAKPRIDG